MPAIGQELDQGLHLATRFNGSAVVVTVAVELLLEALQALQELGVVDRYSLQS